MSIPYHIDSAEYDIAATYLGLDDDELPVSAFVTAHLNRTDTDLTREQVRARVRSMAAGEARFEIDDDGVVHSPMARRLDDLLPDDRENDNGDDDPDHPKQQQKLSLGV